MLFRSNAQAARKESEFVGKSFIRNEKEALIGPLGTAKAIEIGEVEGAMSGLSIVVAGLLTVVGASIFANFL